MRETADIADCVLSQKQQSSIRRLLILRPDHAGDLVLFSGTLKHMRARWPRARIALCVRSYGAELFEYCPHVDEIVPYDELWNELFAEGRLKWMPAFRGGDRVGSWLRRHARQWVFPDYCCDAVLLPVVSPMAEYHEIVQRIPARWRLGIKGSLTNQTRQTDEAAESCYTARMDVCGLAPNHPEADTARRWLRFLGIDTSSSDALRPEFWTSQHDVQRAEELLPSGPRTLRLGIAASVTSLPGKNLPASWFANTLRRLDAGSLEVVCFGGPADAPASHALEAALAEVPGVRVLNLAGETSIRELIECMKRCDLFLCQETAALHLAIALHKPVAAIVGGGNYGRFFPWGDPALWRVLHRKMDCFGCNWICCHETIRCIQDITPAEASSALRDLLDSVVKRNAK